MKPSELLKRAADVIRHRGHCKRILQDSDGRVCVFGALNAVATNSPNTFPHTYDRSEASPYTQARDYLAALVPKVDDMWCDGSDTHISIVEWNNAPERTSIEVIVALETAAAGAEGEGQ